MYCICRRRASWRVIVRASVMASDEVLRQAERGKAFGIERDERDAEILQLVHFVLAARLRRRFAQVFAGRRRIRAQRGIGAGHRVAARGATTVRVHGLCYHSRRPLFPLPMPILANADRPVAPARMPDSGAGESHFPVATEVLERVAHIVLDAARDGGATAAETEVSQAVGQSVSVRKGEVETIAYNRDKGIGVTVYVGARRGHASSADFSDESLRATVDKALAIARYTAEDPAAGLADPDRLAKAWPDLDLYHPWELRRRRCDRARARDGSGGACRRSAHLEQRGLDGRARRIRVRLREQRGILGRLPQLAPSHRLLGDRRGRRRDAARLLVHGRARAGGPRSACRSRPHRRRAHRAAARRTPARHARMPGRCSTRRKPRDLLGSFVHAVSGGSLYRKSSFLLDSLGTQVFAPHVNIREEPHLPRARGSAPFDSEGVATQSRDVVVDGVLRGYFLGSYSARKLGLQSTGNAGGAHNLVVPGTDDLPALLRRMGRGLFVTEQLGQGVNPVTGDFSRGAAGFWIEDGEIAYPVEEITIAGNLRRMFRDIVALGNDIDRRGSRHIGSILVAQMTVAGA